MKHNYVVYKHTSPTGKVYIGITKQNPVKRWKKGYGYKDNARFFNAIKKYGWDNFTHEIIVDSISKEEAEAKEIELIAAYDSANRDKGYNIELGGFSNIQTEETRQKISDSVRAMWEDPERREKICGAMKNVKRSAEACENISVAQRKRFENPIERERISIRQKGQKRDEAAKAKTSESLKAYYSDPENKEKYRKSHEGINRKYHAKNVRCIETDEVFEAVIDAENKYKIDHRNIVAVCRGKRKKAGGFHWEYA